MLSVAEAVARIPEGIAPREEETVPLRDAHGRVLAEDVRSTITLPHWTNSAMDGYAVRGADVIGATDDGPSCGGTERANGRWTCRCPRPPPQVRSPPCRSARTRRRAS